MHFVNIGSDLERKRWVLKGLLQKRSLSFWDGLTGGSDDAVVHQENNTNAKDGHTVVFDHDGNLSGKPIKGKETAFGKGEEKRKLSDKISVFRYRLPVNNGDKFDGVEIGDLNITQHQDSISKLADLFVRVKDQFLFDAAQGLLAGQTPSHIIDLGSTFGYNQLLDIEKVVKTSVGYTTGGTRRPLKPYRLANGKAAWFFIVDAFMKLELQKDSNYQALVFNADVRGEDNRAIKGIIGKIGQLYIVEADQFFGSTASIASTFEIEDSGVEVTGLRQKDGASLWTGQPGFSVAGDLFSRGLLMGAGALQIAFGMHPDYKFQESTDFGITSESALEVWTNAQKTNLVMEKSELEYEKAKVSNLDYGVVAVDVQVQ